MPPTASLQFAFHSPCKIHQRSTMDNYFPSHQSSFRRHINITNHLSLNLMKPITNHMFVMCSQRAPYQFMLTWRYQGGPSLNRVKPFLPSSFPFEFTEYNSLIHATCIPLSTLLKDKSSLVRRGSPAIPVYSLLEWLITKNKFTIIDITDLFFTKIKGTHHQMDVRYVRPSTWAGSPSPPSNH